MAEGTTLDIKIAGIVPAEFQSQFNEAMKLVVKLHEKFNGRRLELLKAREVRQLRIDKGELPDFLPETKSIRESEWVAAPIPADLQDRRVEITGPVDRKMIINALNSGAKMFMADFEDSNSPTWSNCIEGQINLKDAINKTITYTNPENGKDYKLNDKTATLLVRPRGWHLPEKHVTIGGEAVSGSLFDFGIYFYINAKQLIANGTGPYFYLPKMESHLEARLWNDVFVFAQNELGIPQGTIKATVLIETITATFELHEIIYELREHMAGLNCGRWDYIFSYIKKFRNLDSRFVLPDRAQVTMAVPFMSNYSKLVIQTCHKRRVHAMGGMAAFIPIKGDEAANNAAIEKVKQDKLREVNNGHDGTWVAHPGLVKVAMDIFNEHMPTPNNYTIKREGETYTQKDLLELPAGTITEAGLRMNINVGILYLESWLRGVGAAALHNLMEDAATAEISRTQVWQWLKNKSKLDDGREVTVGLVDEILPSEVNKIIDYVGEEAYEKGEFDKATSIFYHLITQKEYVEFLTLPAYDEISLGRLTTDNRPRRNQYRSQMAFKFEKLIVWQEAMRLGEDMYHLTRKFPKDEMFNLTSQTMRAVDSIGLNISEGAMGQTDPENRKFIGYSIRSCAEVISCLYKASARKYITKEEFDKCYNKVEVLFKKLNKYRSSINQ